MITGVGSLPSLGAMDLVSLACPTLPFWPQDPAGGPYSTMIGESLLGFEAALEALDAGVRFEVFDPQSFLRLLREGQLPELPAALQRFEAGLTEGRFPRADGVKGQIVGPVTLAACLEHKGEPLLRLLPEDQLLPALALRLSVLAANQISALTKSGLPVQVWIDEPCLPECSRVAQKALRTLMDSIRSAGARVGLHCCAGASLDLLARLEPEVLSFDAWTHLEAFCADPLARKLVASARRIAWGVIPTAPEVLRTVSVAGLVDRWMTAVKPLGDPRDLRRRALFTATCGLGTLSYVDAVHGFAVLSQFDDHLRAACES